MESVRRNAEALVEKSMKGNDASHDAAHVWRVRDLALSLAKEEGLSSHPHSMQIVTFPIIHFHLFYHSSIVLFKTFHYRLSLLHCSMTQLTTNTLSKLTYLLLMVLIFIFSVCMMISRFKILLCYLGTHLRKILLRIFLTKREFRRTSSLKF